MVRRRLILHGYTWEPSNQIKWCCHTGRLLFLPLAGSFPLDWSSGLHNTHLLHSSLDSWSLPGMQPWSAQHSIYINLRRHMKTEVDVQWKALSNKLLIQLTNRDKGEWLQFLYLLKPSILLHFLFFFTQGCNLKRMWFRSLPSQYINIVLLRLLLLLSTSYFFVTSHLIINWPFRWEKLPLFSNVAKN